MLLVHIDRDFPDGLVQIIGGQGGRDFDMTEPLWESGP